MSEELNGNLAAHTLDGDLTNTFWESAGTEYIEYDLNGTKTVSSIDIAFKDGHLNSYEVNIKYSMDGNSWTSLYRGFSSGTTESLENLALQYILCLTNS